MPQKLLRPAALVLLCAALALCWVIGKSYEPSVRSGETELPLTEAEAAELHFPLLALTRADQDTEGEGALDLDLSACTGECLITEGGTFRLRGSLNGTLRIAAEEQTVHLLLDNVTVTSPSGPALLAESAGKLILTLPENTVSTFSDSGRYAGSDDEACVSCRADLTINGKGALVVNGFYKDAVRSAGVVRIPEGEITIKCKRTGIHGADGIFVGGGKLNISSEKHGLRTTKSGAEGRGSLVVAGGDHRIIAGRYAFLTARGDLYVYRCRIYDTSIVSTYSVGGQVRIQSGCFK